MLEHISIGTWSAVYRVSYYVLLGSLLVSFIATGLVFIASNRTSDDLTERLTATTDRATRLEAAAAPREVGLPTGELIAAAKSRRLIVRVSSYAFDVEGARLGNLMIALLDSVGIVTQDFTLSEQAMRPMVFGVNVIGQDASLVQLLDTWLAQRDLLRVPPPASPIGVTPGRVQYGISSGPDVPLATIFIGSKPLPKMMP